MKPRKQVQIDPHHGTSFSFPFIDDGVTRFGELAMAIELNEDNLLEFFKGEFGCPRPIGEEEIVEVLLRGGEGSWLVVGGADSPDAASVRRNSTQRREKD